jgi:hypothetical protein
MWWVSRRKKVEPLDAGREKKIEPSDADGYNWNTIASKVAVACRVILINSLQKKVDHEQAEISALTMEVKLLHTKLTMIATFK